MILLLLGYTAQAPGIRTDAYILIGKVIQNLKIAIAAFRSRVSMANWCYQVVGGVVGFVLMTSFLPQSNSSTGAVITSSTAQGSSRIISRQADAKPYSVMNSAEQPISYTPPSASPTYQDDTAAASREAYPTTPVSTRTQQQTATHNRSPPQVPTIVLPPEVVANDLEEIKRAFRMIDTEHVASLIAPGIFAVIDQVMCDDVRAVRTAKVIPTVPRVYEAVIRTRTQILLKKVLDRVFENDPTVFIDFRTLLASAAAVEEQSTRTMTRRAIRFVTMSSCLGAAVAVVLQFMDYLVLSRAWSTAVVLSAVVAEGVFLSREEGHIRQLGAVAFTRVLGSRLLWRELATGSRSSALTAIITQELKAESSFLIYNTAATGKYREFAVKIRDALPSASAPADTYVDSVLDADNRVLRRGLGRVNDNFAACVL